VAQTLSSDRWTAGPLIHPRRAAGRVEGRATVVR
jgi:hypothetical protein